MIEWKVDTRLEPQGHHWSGWLKMPQPSPWNYLCFYNISPKFFGGGFVVKTWLGRKRKARCETVAEAKAIAEGWLANP